MSIVLALPKGRILDECAPLLGAAGIIPAPDYANESSRRLRFPTNHPSLDIVRVRSFDVATFVAFGAAEIGICGGDVLMEFDYPEVYAPLDLNIGHCRISVAEPKDEAGLTKLYELSSIRVASKYPSVTRRHFASRGVQAEIVALNGSMELAPGLGLSRLIVDLVQTGSTLKANGLVETDIIAKVSSRLIVNRIAFKTRPDEIGAWIERFSHRIDPKMRRLNADAADFEANFAQLLSRAVTEPQVTDTVREIIARVRRDGDAAVVDLTNQFDRVQLDLATLTIREDEIAEAAASISADLRAALTLAATRIEAFHRAQLPADQKFTDATGTTLGLRWGPLDAVGIYVPGGKASYPSSVLMNAIPAKVAGVSRIAMCVPAPDGILNPLVLAAAQLAGVTEIYRIGGAQAVAALAYGTALISPVDRIVGPGNAYVAEAKRQVFGQVGIDSIAGPSEVLILADAANNPEHVALDLLAQAEHDEAAQAILITDDANFAAAVAAAVDKALTTLPRGNIAGASWEQHGAIILVQDWAQAISLANRVAPEHLQLMVQNPEAVFANIRHAGAVFLGPNCPEAIGDYVAGPNHVLPTSGTARFASGLSVYDFLKRTTWVALDRAALNNIGPAAVALANAEGLTAHAQSVAVRLGKT